MATMRDILANRVYAKLFGAQVIALIGTGLLTVALGLLAFDLAGGDAGIVLGTALTIKMVAYVGVAPLSAAMTSHLPRKLLLVSSDAVRGTVAVSLPFVTEVWQIFVLIFVLQAASATFTPAFQALIPEVLPDEGQYTRALSLSRLAYDLESLLSPVIAAALLTVISYHNLFLGTAFGFLGSAVLVLAATLPGARPHHVAPFVERLTSGVGVFRRTPELRALAALNLGIAAATAMVLVNTVVLVQQQFSRPAVDVAVALACYGLGSMIVALSAPRLIARFLDRRVMLFGSAVLPVGLVLAAGIAALADPLAGSPLSHSPAAWAAALGIWFLLGAATSLILTPSARLLRRASTTANGPAVFAAQFSLSHACFILTYPLAGLIGAFAGLSVAALALAVVAAAAAWLALREFSSAGQPAEARG